MKTTFLLFLLAFSFNCYSQDSTWIFSRTITLEKISQDKIFTVAKEFFVNNNMGNSNKFNLEVATGKITGSGAIKAMGKGLNGDKGIVTYYFKFLSKDGKCKLELFDFEHSLIMANGGRLENEKPKCGNFSISQKQWTRIKEFTKEQTESLLNSFQKRMELLTEKPEDF